MHILCILGVATEGVGQTICAIKHRFVSASGGGNKLKQNKV